MKFLHTSDWHLGRTLYGRKRYDEFSQFLEWLGSTIENENINVLLVSGDVFDTSIPSNRSQELYYRFLCRVSSSQCRHVVITAGNHDSPSFLNAPKELLRALNVYVIGSITDDPEDEVIVLKDEQNTPQAIVCAVPYLRDKDLRTVEAGETIDVKNAKLVAGLKEHYCQVCAIAEHKQQECKEHCNSCIPIIAMGHLFTAGGKTVDGDGVRELYVGSLAHVEEDVFPSSIDYLALGHLHVPQCVGKSKHIRDCGSPIPMGFAEAHQDKKVIIVQFTDINPSVKEIKVPCFQPLEQIVGSFNDIYEKIQQLKSEGSKAWLEIEYTGNEVISNLREICDEALGDSLMEILRIRNKPVIEGIIHKMQEDETLGDLDIYDVFERMLKISEISSEERDELTASYREVITSLQDEDFNAE